MSNSNTIEYYVPTCLFLDPWLKVLPNFHHVFRQGNVEIYRFTNSSGYSTGIRFRKDKKIKIYAKENWKENSPEVLLAIIDTFYDIEKQGEGRIKTFSITIEVPYLRFDVKTVPNKKQSTGYKRQTHIVKSGENLTQIAKKNQTTVLSILKINPQIKDQNLIKVGQIIKIPTKGA